ncbi:unnamed protein product [Brassica oleracea]
MSKETAIRTSESSPPLLFRQVSPGPGDSTMQFRLLHFWDAHKNVKGGPWILLGIEMLMIDAEINLPLTVSILTGKLCLSSMSSSRVFFDEEVDPTKEYLAWLTTNPSVTSLVNPVEVVKAETLTISEIAAFLKHQPAQVAYFDCISTIDDVKLGTEWYYIACKDCQTKLNRGPTTLLCPKCGNENATAVANYRVELSVYDNDEQCTFIILGDAGKDLTWRKATELIDAYVQENGGDAAELEVPLPQCFIDTIG